MVTGYILLLKEKGTTWHWIKKCEKIVESYHGNMEIEINEDIFSVKTFLYISKIEN